ncbi:MAG TPA: Kdo hydroxylase family protein [Terracidiphilus sp.]|nr:Kdo hydroxylase family protein [Terracidiphilus sp.]
MPVHSISPDALEDGRARDAEQSKSWCAALEAGEILYFPRTPVPIPPADLEFLLSRQQTNSGLHKNIAYKPDRDQLSGVDRKTADPAQFDQLQGIMRRYSAAVESFLAVFLAPYARRWRLDYASYRPIEEQGRDLPTRRRNDLLHTDAFPTRPTRGWRILRFFHNIHPSRTRDWVIGEPFGRVVGSFAPGKLALPHSDSPVARSGKQIAQATGLASLVPQWKRTPYDEFMMRLHNTMKEDSAFQASCVRENVQFAPGSSWMVYTETVPHAVLAGQYALEQTFLVDPAAMVTRESAPVAILEKMTASRLV